MAFILHFKDDGTKKDKTVVFFFVLYSPTFLSHFHKRQCFLSNGTKNMHNLASGAERQAVRFGYVILGEN